jgi:hypothetical protein
MKTQKRSDLRALLDLPLTPEVDGMIRILLDAENERAPANDTGGPRYSVIDGPVSSLRRHVVLQLAATRSETLFDAVARLGVWRAAEDAGADRESIDDLAQSAVEDLITLARDYAASKRFRSDAVN